jgi:hypothetical protein
VVKGGKKGKQHYNKHKQRQRGSSPSDKKKLPLCWLHIHFGDKARRCEQPCDWSATEN